jgi:hypothetical protein
MAFKPLAIKNIERTKPVDNRNYSYAKYDNVLNCIKGILAHPLQQISKNLLEILYGM